MIRGIIAGCVLATSSVGHTSGFELGVGFDVSTDLQDPGLDQGAAKMGFGPSLRAPLRWTPHPKVALRSDAFFSMMGGQDRVEWSQYNGEVGYYSEDHWTLLTQLGLSLGPEIAPWSAADVSPYLGASVGVSWVRHWHSFNGDSAVLLDPAENELDRGSNIDPFTDQIAPHTGFQAGIRFTDVLPFAFEAELGYNVAFLRAAPLKKARPALNAVRTAYGFNPVRIGFNAVFPL